MADCKSEYAISVMSISFLLGPCRPCRPLSAADLQGPTRHGPDALCRATSCHVFGVHSGCSSCLVAINAAALMQSLSEWQLRHKRPSAPIELRMTRGHGPWPLLQHAGTSIFCVPASAQILCQPLTTSALQAQSIAIS